MAIELLHGRQRAIGMAGTVGVHVLVVAVLLLFAPRLSPLPAPPEPGI